MITVSTDRLRPSPRLVVAFGGLQQKLGGIRSEFYRSLERLDCAALFVTDPGRRWYQYEPAVIAGLLDEIRQAAARCGARRLVCIGNSMGGFGALLFGARLGADAILGFAPQTAIDPAITDALGDRRWTEYQAMIPAYPFGDLAKEPPAAGRAIICRGEDFPLDIAHSGHLAAVWPLEVITVPEARHDAAARLREAGQLIPLLEEIICG